MTIRKLNWDALMGFFLNSFFFTCYNSGNALQDLQDWTKKRIPWAEFLGFDEQPKERKVHFLSSIFSSIKLLKNVKRNKIFTIQIKNCLAVIQVSFRKNPKMEYSFQSKIFKFFNYQSEQTFVYLFIKTSFHSVSCSVLQQ